MHYVLCNKCNKMQKRVKREFETNFLSETSRRAGSFRVRDTSRRASTQQARDAWNAWRRTRTTSSNICQEICNLHTLRAPRALSHRVVQTTISAHFLSFASFFLLLCFCFSASFCSPHVSLPFIANIADSYFYRTRSPRHSSFASYSIPSVVSPHAAFLFSRIV